MKRGRGASLKHFQFESGVVEVACEVVGTFSEGHEVPGNSRVGVWD